jgi:ATP-dependent RNA helicase RhlE
MTFNELNIIDPICQALSRKGYTEPTPIQEKAIPHVLAGSDLFGCAQTGTGKTAGFALPILQLLSQREIPGRNRPLRALILAPTRELALQINENITYYGSLLRIKNTVIFGGVSQNAQTAALREGVDILVATPGRLMDLMNQGYISLSAVEFFVLDEADRMLDMGFISDIRKIAAKIPKKRQTIFFSATLPPEIKKLADSLLSNPSMINVSPVSSASDNVEQAVYYVEKTDKRELLKYILQNDAIPHALVFTRSKHRADRLARELNKKGIRADAIHGDKSQNSRQRALSNFKSRQIQVLVATDIASRGIDVDKLSHVINYELPEHAETYVHRIGRTGRAGEKGCAISLCDPEEVPYLKSISKLIQKPISVVENHPFSTRQSR